MQGAKGNVEMFDIDVDVRFKTNNISVPLLLRYKFGKGFYAQAGPQLGFLASAKVKLEANGESEEEDIKDDMENFDLSINLGFGYELESGLGFNLCLVPGLIKIFKEDDIDAKHVVLQLTVSYAF